MPQPNQHSQHVRLYYLIMDAKARMHTLQCAATDLGLYLRQADRYAAPYLPSDWYAGAQALLDEMSSTVQCHKQIMCGIDLSLIAENDHET